MIYVWKYVNHPTFHILVFLGVYGMRVWCHSLFYHFDLSAIL